MNGSRFRLAVIEGMADTHNPNGVVVAAVVFVAVASFSQLLYMLICNSCFAVIAARACAVKTSLSKQLGLLTVAAFSAVALRRYTRHVATTTALQLLRSGCCVPTAVALNYVYEQRCFPAVAFRLLTQ